MHELIRHLTAIALGAMACFCAAAATADGAAPTSEVAATADGGTWVLTSNRLWFVGPDGRTHGDVPLIERGYGAPTRLVVDPYDGTAWVATGAKLLLHVDAAGELLAGTTMPALPDAMSLALDQSIWVLAGGGILHHAHDGRWLETRSVPALSSIRPSAIAVDSLGARLWIVGTNELTQIDLDTMASPAKPRISLDCDVGGSTLDPRTGRLFVSCARRLLAFDRDAALDLDVDLGPFGIDAAHRLLHDFATDTVIVAGPNTALRIAADGTSIELLDAASAAARVRPTPFSIVPTLALVRPPDGAATYDPETEIVLGVGAACAARACGIPTAYAEGLAVTVELRDGRSINTSIDATAGRAIVDARPALRPGVNHISARVTDRFGHRADLIDAQLTLLDQSDVSTSGFAAGLAGSLTDPAPEAMTKAANKAPTVTLTSPSSGAVFTAGSAVTLAATATDSDGSIAKVEFYRNATILIGTATTSPYMIVWAGVAEGIYPLSAIAYDNRNGKATSAVVDITVTGNQGPSVTLASPSDGSFHVAGSPITLVASASDPDGQVASVEFLDGDKSLASVSAAPWTWTWQDAGPGRHAITVRAVDDRGAASTSTVAYVVVGDAPKVVVTQPAGCSQFDGPLDLPIDVDAATSAGSIVSVELFDGATVIGTLSKPPWRFTIGNAAIGTHSISARATDSHGLATTSRAALIEVRGANQPPNVSLATPADGARYPIGSTVGLTANASDPDGTIAAVEYRIGVTGLVIGRATSPPYAIAWSGMASGTYGLVAVAYDDRGATATSAAANVTIAANAMPTITLTAPAGGATFVAPAAIGLAAAASDIDGTVAKVEFFSGSMLVGTATSAPFAATWTDVAAGSYTLTARATDDLGATATSSPLSVTVTANAPPVISLGTPAPGARFFAPATIQLGASASDPDGAIARVDFYANGTLVASAPAAPFNAVWDGAPAGSYALVAVATDNRGATTASGTVDILVGAGVTIAATAGLDGSIIDDDSVLVSGTIDAPANSGVLVNGVVAQLDAGGRFYANSVPLSVGQNAVTFLLTSPDGDEVAQTITVTSSGPAPFAVTAAPTDGLAPLEVRFDVTNRGNLAFGRVEFDFDGNGSTDHTALAAQFVDGVFAVAATYPAGTFTSTIRVYDKNDAILYATTRVVTVRTIQQQDALLQGVYNGMLTRLRLGKIATALNAVTGGVHDKYNAVFESLGAALPAAIDTLGTLEANWFSLDQAEYVVIRDTPDGPQAFLIDFLRGKDGIWRIEGM